MKMLDNGVVFLQDRGVGMCYLSQCKSVPAGTVTIMHSRSGFHVGIHKVRYICKTNTEEDALRIAGMYAEK